MQLSTAVMRETSTREWRLRTQVLELISTRTFPLTALWNYKLRPGTKKIDRSKRSKASGLDRSEVTLIDSKDLGSTLKKAQTQGLTTASWSESTKRPKASSISPLRGNQLPQPEHSRPQKRRDRRPTVFSCRQPTDSIALKRGILKSEYLKLAIEAMEVQRPSTSLRSKILCSRAARM